MPVFIESVALRAATGVAAILIDATLGAAAIIDGTFIDVVTGVTVHA
jgi:hypothetical protein